MIFVTVGSLHPFDRLIQTVDQWVGDCRASNTEVLAQIGSGAYRPRHCRFVSELSPAEYRDLFAKADLIVAHAGMGTIITAIELGKPIVVMPRRSEFNEHVNDHQLATVRHFQRSSMIQVAETPERLTRCLSQQRDSHGTNAGGADEDVSAAQLSLVDFVRSFVGNPTAAE